MASAQHSQCTTLSWIRRYGIDVNQVLYGGVLGKTSGGPCKATPQNSPYYFAANITIRDSTFSRAANSACLLKLGREQATGGLCATVRCSSSQFHPLLALLSQTMCTRMGEWA